MTLLFVRISKTIPPPPPPILGGRGEETMYLEVRALILEPSYVALSCLYQFDDVPLEVTKNNYQIKIYICNLMYV